MSPLAVVGLVLGKAEVQGSNPCRGTMVPRVFPALGEPPIPPDEFELLDECQQQVLRGHVR